MRIIKPKEEINERTYGSFWLWRGVVAGVMLYKYSQEFQKGVDKGEKEIMKGAKQLEEKAEEKMEEASAAV